MLGNGWACFFSLPTGDTVFQYSVFKEQSKVLYPFERVLIIAQKLCLVKISKGCFKRSVRHFSQFSSYLFLFEKRNNFLVTVFLWHFSWFLLLIKIPSYLFYFCFATSFSFQWKCRKIKFLGSIWWKKFVEYFFNFFAKNKKKQRKISAFCLSIIKNWCYQLLMLFFGHWSFNGWFDGSYLIDNLV